MALTQVDQGLLGTNAQYTGFKNRLINSAMVIDQRNAGASVAVSTDGVYSVDRFRLGVIGTGRFSAQQSTTAPAGFSNSLLITVTTSDSSLASTDLYNIRQWIEAFNMTDLAWGTASAATVTLSFWVRSSLTGTFGGSLTNNDYGYSYPYTYTISVANTWEYKTVTITGLTSGTIASGNGRGIGVSFSLGAGSNYTATAGSWSAVQAFGATGETNLIATNGATFYITGVQLEKGSTATSFDYRPYTTELALCQRYYINYGQCGLIAYSTQGVVATVSYPVTMRASPTVSISYNGVANTVYTIQTGATGVITPSIFGTAQGITNFYYLSGSWATGAGTGLATNVVASIEL